MDRRWRGKGQWSLAWGPGRPLYRASPQSSAVHATATQRVVSAHIKGDAASVGAHGLYARLPAPISRPQDRPWCDSTLAECFAQPAYEEPLMTNQRP